MIADLERQEKKDNGRDAKQNGKRRNGQPDGKRRKDQSNGITVQALKEKIEQAFSDRDEMILIQEQH